MTRPVIAFIGGGNMARSLIGGLLAGGSDPTDIRVADPNAEQRHTLEQHYDGITTAADSGDVVGEATVWVLAVKPQVLAEVATGLAAAANRHRPLIISIAAGVRSTDLERWLGGNNPALVRAMPNTPALVGSGATGLYATGAVTPDQRHQAETVLGAVGVTVWVDDEAQLDTVTALSGSGPAYFFRVMEALEQAAVSAGLAADKARLLTLQTAFGAAKMALNSDEDPSTLRTRVTSPGGTTERGLAALDQGGIERLFDSALQAARQRSEELGDILGEQQ